MTREDVLREYRRPYQSYEDVGGPDTIRMADEILRLRAKLQAARERVEKLPTYGPETRFGLTGATMERQEDADWIYRDDVLAALGGDE